MESKLVKTIGTVIPFSSLWTIAYPCSAWDPYNIAITKEKSHH